MKHTLKIFYITLISLLFSNCSLDTRVDLLMTQEDIDSDYSKLKGLGLTGYLHLENGFYRMDGNIEAAMSDEATQTYLNSSVMEFCRGSWNAYTNPDDVYGSHFIGIRKANYFLKYSEDYKNMLLQNRDTLTDGGYSYQLDVKDVGWLREESKVLLAYNYFELLKRYGGVPIITEAILPSEGKKEPKPRNSVEEVVDYCILQIDQALNGLQTNWKSYDQQRDGRFTKGAAMALKSRILLYAASPLFNEGNDLTKWEQAVKV